MSLQDKVMDAQCNELHRLVETSGGRFVCFTRFHDDALVVCASDGLDLWKTELQKEEIDAHCELAEISMKSYLDKVCNSFKTGELIVTQSGCKVSLGIGHGSNSLDLDLYEAKAAEKKVYLQYVLFRLADRATNLETQLEKAKNDIDRLSSGQASASSGGHASAYTDSRKSNAVKTQKKSGMSVVNPGTRKRPAPKGIEFD